MAIQDKLMLFSEAQDLGSISAAGTDQSTDVFDVGADNIDYKGSTIFPPFSDKGDLFAICQVDTEELLASSSSATLTVRLKTHTAATSIKSGTTLLTETVTVSAAASSATAIGTVLMKLPLPVGATYKRYTGFTYNVATKNMSTGKVVSWIGPSAQVIS